MRHMWTGVMCSSSAAASGADVMQELGKPWADRGCRTRAALFKQAGRQRDLQLLLTKTMEQSIGKNEPLLHEVQSIRDRG